MRLHFLTKNGVFLIAFTCVTAVALAFGNPLSTQWPLKCPLFWLTGLQCPLCGMQRMFHELFHLRIASAWHYNSVLLITLPYWALMFLGQLKPEWQTTNPVIRFCYKNITILTLLAIMVAWGMLRNFSN